MKNIKHLGIVLVVLGLVQGVFADDAGSSYAKEGFYVSPQLGGTVVPDVGLTNLEGYQLDADFNPGIRFDIPVGYRVNEWFSLEFAPGVMWNSLNSIKYDNNVEDGSISASGNLIQVPLLVNFILTIPTDSKWEPYLGVGVGGLYSSFTLSNIADLDIDNESGDCWALGYSALAGLNYNISKDISIGFNYKFTGTGNQNWSGDLDGLTTNVYTHSASLTGTFRF